MHNYEQKVLLIYDGASPRLSHLNGSLFPRLGRFREAPAPGVMSQSRLRGFEKEVGQIRLISQLWKKVCVFQTQSICHHPYRAGRRSSASAYAAISKIIALQAIWTKALVLGINGLATTAEAVVPYGGKAPTRGQI